MNRCEEVSLITTPQRTERCWLRSFWPEEPLTAFICAGQCEAARAASRGSHGREGLRRAHCSHWVPPRTGGSGGPGTPPPDAAQRASVHDSLLGISYLFCLGLFFFFPPWLGFFLISRASRWLGERCFRQLHEPAGRSAEFANLSLLSRCQEKEPAHGRGPGPGQPRRAARESGPAPSIARPLLLLPRPVPAEAQAELRAVVAVPQHYLNVCQ